MIMFVYFLMTSITTSTQFRGIPGPKGRQNIVAVSAFSYRSLDIFPRLGTGKDMSEVFSNSITPVAAEGEAGSSRNSSVSPQDDECSMEILEHSMESLVVSYSSEEGILMGEISQGLEVDVAEQLEPDVDLDSAIDIGDSEALIAANEGKVANRDYIAKVQEGAGDGSKEVAKRGKKRRISSRRTRKVNLSDGDRVICEIAGVQVTLVTSYSCRLVMGPGNGIC